MNMIAKLTRTEVEALAFAGLLALLSAISSLSNVAADVDREISARERLIPARAEVVTLSRKDILRSF
jgi:hypothetical protein